MFALSTGLLLCALCITSIWAQGTQFDRVVIIALDHGDFGEALSDQYISALSNNNSFNVPGVVLTNYNSINQDSSIGNWLGVIAGKDENVTNTHMANYTDTTIVDLLEAKSISWKVYAESLPNPCFIDQKSPDGLYTGKTNPFVQFTTITTIPERCNNIVPLSQLQLDETANTVPDYVFIIPNAEHSGFGYNGFDPATSTWLQSFLSSNMNNTAFFNPQTLVFITFAIPTNANIRSGGSSRVWAMLLGQMVSQSNRTDGNAYTHYSLLKTIEDNFSLGNLGRNDSTAVGFMSLNNLPATTSVNSGNITTSTQTSFVNPMTSSNRTNAAVRGLALNGYWQGWMITVGVMFVLTFVSL